MEKNPETDVKDVEVDIDIELADEFEGLDVEKLIPAMNVSKDMMLPEEKESIVKDEQILGLYDEILDNCRTDRKFTEEVLANFLNMVINDGDASSASKEAVVNILKIKTDISDKMAKIADLMTRVKLKEKDTFPRYLAAQQNNKVVIEGSKRELLKSVNKIVGKKGTLNDKGN
jgi:hypothetical protein